MRTTFATALLCLAGLATGCGERPVPDAPSAATVPSFTRAPGARGPSEFPAAAATVTTDETAAEPPAASGAATAAPSSEPLAASAVPSEDASPLPDVDIKNYGMHIGGGPNDNATKAPIREAVRAQNDAFRACFRLAPEGKKEVIFRVELLIPGPGGKAEVTAQAAERKADAFSECMLTAFREVEFRRPPRGQPQRVAYSLRFEAKGAGGAKSHSG